MTTTSEAEPTTQDLLDGLGWSKGKLSRYVTWGLMRPHPVRGSRNSFQWNGAVDFVAGEAMDRYSEVDWSSVIRPLVSASAYREMFEIEDRKQTFALVVRVKRVTEEEAVELHSKYSTDPSADTIIIQTGVSEDG